MNVGSTGSREDDELSGSSCFSLVQLSASVGHCPPRTLDHFLLGWFEPLAFGFPFDRVHQFQVISDAKHLDRILEAVLREQTGRKPHTSRGIERDSSRLREHEPLEVVQLIVSKQRAVEFGRESFEGLLRPEPE